MHKFFGKKICLFSLMVMIYIVPCFAAYSSYGIPDSSDFRKNLVEKWFEAPLESVRLNAPEFYSTSAGQKFQVSLEESDETYNIMVSACTSIQMSIISDSGTKTVQQDLYPGDIPGSFVLIKDKKTDKPIRIRYYFAKDSDVYVQFSPRGRTATADMMIYGYYAAKGVATGVPFSSFYSTSFDDVVKLTERSLPWKYVIVKNKSYNTIMQMAGMIQRRLPKIVLTDDAVYDENILVNVTNGTPMLVEDESKLYLSSAGFLKWIADGLVEPVAGSKLKLDPLLTETVKVKNIGHQGVALNKYSLFFSMDFVRNLSSAVVSVFTGRHYRYDNSGVDVTINPFASAIGKKNVITFIENTGYSVEVLKPLLYVLAATDPGTIYFCALRTTDRTVKPELKIFNECVLLMPYFDESENFRCFVFMNGRQMSLESFCQNYSSDFIYLTKVRSDDRFYPD